MSDFAVENLTCKVALVLSTLAATGELCYQFAMSRPLANNPLGVSDTPNFVTEPARVAELVAMFEQGWGGVLWSFKNARSNEAKYGTFNDSIVRVIYGAKRKRRPKQPKLLHPLVMWRINDLAREAAAERTGDANAAITHADVKKAGIKFGATVRPKRGRPADQTLWNHVELLMALIQRFVGKPVLARRSEDNEYRMFLDDKKARRIFDALQEIDPSISEAQVADIIIKLRRKYAGKDMSFSELADKHGLTMLAVFRKSGFKAPMFERGEPIFPIYSP